MDEISVTKTADAKQQALLFVETHGRFPVTVLCGGAAAAIGSVLPFAYVNGIFGGGSAYSIVQGGFYGFMMVVVAVILGIFPVFLKRYARFTLVAFGVACAVLGVFFALWLASSGIASMIGGAIGGLTVGFYLSLIGYAAMVVGYYLMLAEKRSNA